MLVIKQPSLDIKLYKRPIACRKQTQRDMLFVPENSMRDADNSIPVQHVVIVSRGKRAHAVAAACCSVLMLLLMVSGFITECAGLSHTRNGDAMQRLCPSNYWGSAAGILSLRAIIWFAFAVGAVVYWIQDLELGPSAALFWCGLLLLPLTLSNTVLTAQAWEAVNCTQAMMEDNRDADPLIAAGSSILTLVDWIMLLAAVSWAVAKFRLQPPECEECSECCNAGDSSWNADCCTVRQSCSMVCSGCVRSVYGLSSLIVFIMGLVYAYNKSACPSAFWPFAMTMFFLLPCCSGFLVQTTKEKDEGRFNGLACFACLCVVIVLALSIATFIMSHGALQAEGCESAMGGPFLAVGAIMYAISGLVACVLFVSRFAAVFLK